MCEIMEQSNRRSNMDLLFGLVSEEALSPEKAAEKLNINIDEFFSEMKQAGYKVPEFV